MNTGDTSVEAILLAAETCLEKYGIEKTTMNDVATQAQISRQTLYRRFPRRADLLEAISRNKLDQLNLVIAKRISRVEEPVDKIVETIVTSVFTVLEDPVSRELMHDDARMAMERISTKEYKRIVSGRWGPVIDQARELGYLRESISDQQLIDWFSMLQVAFVSWVEVRDMTKNQLRTFVRNLALSGVLKRE